MTQCQYAFRAIDEATKAWKAWAKFANVELKTRIAVLRKLVYCGSLTDRSLEHQFTEIAIIENELAARDGGQVPPSLLRNLVPLYPPTGVA